MTLFSIARDIECEAFDATRRGLSGVIMPPQMDCLNLEQAEYKKYLKGV